MAQQQQQQQLLPAGRKAASGAQACLRAGVLWLPCA